MSPRLFSRWFGLSRSESRRVKPIARPRLECLEGRQLMTAGYFDTTFNQTGRTAISFTAGNLATSDRAEAVAIQNDGKIVVAGELSPAIAGATSPCSG
jgi:hypothetical protein